MDDDDVICPGVNVEADGVSMMVRGGGALLKDGMEDRGDVPPGEKLDAPYSRGWSARGPDRCDGGGGIGGRGSWPWGAKDEGLGATACLML